MVPDPPGSHMPAGRDYHLGRLIGVQHFGIFYALADIEVGKRDRVKTILDNLNGFFIRVAVQIAAVDFSSLCRQRAIDINREILDAFDQLPLLNLPDKNIIVPASCPRQSLG